jgi:hypothetical protein
MHSTLPKNYKQMMLYNSHISLIKTINICTESQTRTNKTAADILNTTRLFMELKVMYLCNYKMTLDTIPFSTAILKKHLHIL